MISAAAYLHPIAGGAVILLLLYAGSLGLRARNDRRREAALLAQHARWAPVAFWLTILSWAGGAGSTWWWRHDLELLSSAHFQIGSALCATLLLSGITSRWMSRAWMRAIHPWCGAAAMLLAAAQVFFGLQITP
jgi:hypothetical protein